MQPLSERTSARGPVVGGPWFASYSDVRTGSDHAVLQCQVRRGRGGPALDLSRNHPPGHYLADGLYYRREIPTGHFFRYRTGLGARQPRASLALCASVRLERGWHCVLFIVRLLRIL